MMAPIDIGDACVGDPLIVRSSAGYSGDRLDTLTVSRVTKTQVVVEKPRQRKFWKKNGREVGSDVYNGPRASLVTAELLAQIDNQEAKARMNAVVRRLEKLPLRTRFDTKAMNAATAAVGALVSDAEGKP